MSTVFRFTVFLLFLACGTSAQAKIFLLLDDRFKGSALEQSIYKFVPLTSATEVELNYTHDFIKSETAFEFGRKMKTGDRAIYIGTERWPDDAYLSKTVNRREWFDMLGKISFLIENNAPAYAQMPKGMFPRSEIWKKYAEVSATRYMGFHNKHTLDTRPEKLGDSAWPGFTCVHDSGREFTAGKKSPLAIAKGQFILSFRTKQQLSFAGNFVCINTPKADAIFEVRAIKSDVSLEVATGRFSAWNEARPLPITVRSNRLITAPLSLEIVPEVNQTAVDFVFQGEKITCEKNKCRKKAARFLMPALNEFENHFELAIRGNGAAYFRGVFRLMAGEIEVARALVKFTPHSWVAETTYALSNPSEYQSLFSWGLAAFTAVVLLLYALWRLLVYGVAKIRALKKPPLPRQTSVSLEVIAGQAFRITASQNPFGCELADFGAIVDFSLTEETVIIGHGSRGTQSFSPQGFVYDFADGYRMQLRPLAVGRWLLDIYQLSGKGSSPTSAIPSQIPDRQAVNV
ncbi:MAG: hypothetical protein U1F27_15935 [Turneriella sp.]